MFLLINRSWHEGLLQDNVINESTLVIMIDIPKVTHRTHGCNAVLLIHVLSTGGRTPVKADPFGALSHGIESPRS